MKKSPKRVLNEALIYEILSVVSEIPEGRAASYGQIAKLIGRDNNARLVGKVLSMAQYYGEYPCHRVVNHQGRCAPHFTQQRYLLEREGVGFNSHGCVDMKRYGWDPQEASFL
ncbi:MAG: MGMT family protein [Acetatifactor sp.]|nr:MGMT family protein [Acetatifactor sp.]